jgi:hypothetical protein
MIDVALPAHLIVWIVFSTSVCGGFLGSRALAQFILSSRPRQYDPPPGWYRGLSTGRDE